MGNDEHLDHFASTVDGGSSRDGYLWVNPHTHEILGPGEGPRPTDLPHVKMRRYFSDLQRGLTEFGEYSSEPSKRDDVLRVCEEMENILGTPFRECFFVTNDTKSRSSHYLAIVFGNRQGASVWAMKNAIHATAKVRNSMPYRDSTKIFQVELAGFHEKGHATKKPFGASQATCPTSGYYLPVNGLCDYATPDCTVCGDQFL